MRPVARQLDRYRRAGLHVVELAGAVRADMLSSAVGCDHRLVLDWRLAVWRLRVTQQCGGQVGGIDSQHRFEARCRAAGAIAKKRLDASVDGKGQGIDTLFVGFDGIAAGWQRFPEPAQGERVREGDRGSGRAKRDGANPAKRMPCGRRGCVRAAGEKVFRYGVNSRIQGYLQPQRYNGSREINRPGSIWLYFRSRKYRKNQAGRRYFRRL